MIGLFYPVNEQLDTTITLPGSKYLANRLLILAALSESDSTLHNMPHNEDIEASINGLSALGARFSWSGNTLGCEGFPCIGAKGDLEFQSSEIYSSHSGSFSRFILPVLALGVNTVTINGSEKMNTRPMAELFRVLETLGAKITSQTQNPPTTLPVQVTGPIQGGEIEMSGSTSSQYISAILMIAGRLKQGLTIKLQAEPVSKPYLEMTLDLLRLFSVQAKANEDLTSFTILADQQYQGINYKVESDPSSASYFLAAAAISAGHICISNFFPENSLQGEAQFATVLEQMGCKIWHDEQGYHCQGPEKLKAVTVDMGDMPDVVQTLAVVAMFAEGNTHVSNIENLAYKESNRIEDTATEIRKTGIEVVTGIDFLTIKGGKPEAAILDTHDDHRMAMSLALMSIKTKGIQIRKPEVVAKSFPDYWQYLEKLGYAVKKVPMT